MNIANNLNQAPNNFTLTNAKVTMNREGYQEYMMNFKCFVLHFTQIDLNSRACNSIQV